MKQYDLNDTEQVRMDAINLVDNLTEYVDAGDSNEIADGLFRDLIHHLIINGFIDSYRPTDHNNIVSINGLSDNKLYTIHPTMFTYFLIKYCFLGSPHEQFDLNFSDWRFVTGVLMKYFM